MQTNSSRGETMTDAALELLIDKILASGLPDDEFYNPFFLVLFDAEGKPWPLPPHEMIPAQVLEYIRHRYGAGWAQWSRDYSQLTVH